MPRKTKIGYWKFGHYSIIGAWSLVIKNKRRGLLTSPLLDQRHYVIFLPPLQVSLSFNFRDLT